MSIFCIEITKNDDEFIGEVNITANNVERTSDNTILADGVEINFCDERILNISKIK